MKAFNEKINDSGKGNEYNQPWRSVE